MRVFFLVKADLQRHKSNDRHADTVITVTDSAKAVRDKNADCFSCRNIYEHKEYFAHVLFMFETDSDHAAWSAFLLENHELSRYFRIQLHAGMTGIPGPQGPQGRDGAKGQTGDKCQDRGESWDKEGKKRP